MPYIYKITNNKNGKSYVGKTLETVETRWREHIREAARERSDNRPLYAAIKKYGVDAFSIEILEEPAIEDVDEREIFWIEYLETFKDGYNATVGGDGRAYIDYNLVLATYRITQAIDKTAYIVGCGRDTVRKILKALDEPVRGQQEIMRERYGKPLGQFDLQDNLIAVYSSGGEAGKAIGKPKTHLLACANGDRKTAYGFKWKFI